MDRLPNIVGKDHVEAVAAKIANNPAIMALARKRVKQRNK